ncbi:Alpha/Beta hydrolase protein [Pseudoneurospora amorphoporcata]|uniref:Alpha/Beta hydrolase protein n=1 Tax=Pseudoneurospora amorphoporcata TaxID=241081 RepID=A0AAN6NRM0_9PEZI|nr:Alpha/Beta hydrolase protein [Pseudoneurospora amorphoporcata]
MASDALTPHDPRVTHHFTTIPSTPTSESITYHYLLANPNSSSFPNGPTSTVLLLHGWPDLSLGWRYQVPFLLSLGLRVIIPDMFGYGLTSSPSSPTEYSLKKLSAHMAHIIRQVTSSTEKPFEPVLLGTHDWGAFLGWRLAIYYPELIKGVFAFCIPYTPPEGEVTSLEEHVRKHPELGYQLQNAGGDIDKAVAGDRKKVRGWLNAMFGGVDKEAGAMAFDPWKGLDLGKLDEVGASPLVGEEIMDFYVDEYSRNGIQGPMNWYRTREINLQDELPLAEKYANWQFQVPVMIVMVGHDPALPPELTDGMEKYFAKGLRKEVVPEASHWVLIHTPEEVNKLVGEFLEQFL